MVPRVNTPEGIKTPDYIINGERCDLKTLTEDATENTIFNRVQKSRKQADNFIIDISYVKLEDTIVKKQVDKIFKTNSTKNVKSIIIIKNMKLLKAFKRN